MQNAFSKAVRTSDRWPCRVALGRRARHVNVVTSPLIPGLAFEFESAAGRASESQDEWLRFLQDEAGWMVLIVRSAEEARRAVQFYLDVELPEV